MTVQQLLAPRYKVIADFPGSTYNVEEVIQCNEENTEHKQWPAIFQPLQWWEEREPGVIEGIKYLAWVKPGTRTVFELLNWNFKAGIAVWNKQGYGPPLIECEPTTEDEYNLYRKQQEERWASM